MLREGYDTAASALMAQGIDLRQLRAEIAVRGVGERALVPVAPRQFADEMTAILSQASIEAQHSGQRSIGTGHLLLGLLDTSECRAARLLRTLGFAPEKLRAAVMRLLDSAEKA